MDTDGFIDNVGIQIQKRQTQFCALWYCNSGIASDYIYGLCNWLSIYSYRKLLL